MPESALPFFVDGLRVGIVPEVEHHTRFNRGKLELETTNDSTEKTVFQVVVQLAKQVDTCEPERYQQCWYGWNRGCSELQDLNLWIGNAGGPVEEFSIDSSWVIEWVEFVRDNAVD